MAVPQLASQPQRFTGVSGEQYNRKGCVNLEDLLFKRCEICGKGHYVIPLQRRSGIKRDMDKYRGFLECDSCSQVVPRIRYTTEEETEEEKIARERLSSGI